jgi:hypothetical protein
MSIINEFLTSEDPLTREVALFLASYSEEDDRVDYKQSFDPSLEKDWLEITKDISAFANTIGGYIVFGISDLDKNIVGLGRDIANTLKDINNLRQKINRHLDPDISLLRSKEFRISGKSIVVLYIPQSVGITHLISNDGSFIYPSGTEKTILRKGTFYIRRSAGNHLGDSRDFDDVIERRIDQFRESLMNKVARVVSSPANSDMFILTRDSTAPEGGRFIIEDSPDSIPIKGMSFTIPPEGIEEEISAWSVLNRGTSEIRPPKTILWHWYSERENIQINDEQKLAVFRFSLWGHVPAFYWIKDLKSQTIQDELLITIRNRPIGYQTDPMLKVAAFLGKSTYNRSLSVLGDYINRLSPRIRHYPRNGPRAAFGSIDKYPKQSLSQFKKEQLDNLNNIANKAAEARKEPGLQEQWTAIDIDCYLYANDNRYK